MDRHDLGREHDLEPSEVRARIRREHDLLRRTLHRLQALAQRSLEGESLTEPMRAALASFAGEFQRHLSLEDRLLVPTLREVDPQGDVTANSVEEHHREQRVELERILREALDPATAPRATAEAVIRLTDVLLADMAQEDRAVLRPDLLRDDVIGIDVDDG